MRKLLLTILFTLLASPAYTAMVPSSIKTIDSGLIGWWTFDGDTLINNVTDSSNNSNNGRLVNFPATSSAVSLGKIGQGLMFDGTNDYVHVGDVQTVDDATSLSGCAWTKVSSTTADSYIFAKSNGITDGFVFFRDDVDSLSSRTDTYTIYIGESSGTGSVRLSAATNSSKPNIWIHVCFTYLENATGGLRLYINGIEDANSPVSTAGIIGLNSGGNFLTLGSGSTGATNFNGSLDDIRIYNRVLSIQEIKQIYNTSAKVNQSIKGVDQGLVGWWTFDGSKMISNVTDSSSSNNGRLVNFGATSSSVIAGKIGQGLKFDGVNDYVNANSGASFVNKNQGTFSIWVKVNKNSSTSQANPISPLCVSDGTSSNGIYIEATGSIINFYYTQGGGTVKPSSSAILNRWYHVTGTWDASFVKLYVNGVLAQSLGQGTIISNSLSTLYSGSDCLGTQTGYFSGSLDDVRIYNRALSPAEVMMLYNNH